MQTTQLATAAHELTGGPKDILLPAGFARLPEDGPSTSYKTRPVRDISALNAFPPAAREREIFRIANTFVSSGKTIFTHYVEPILLRRRAEVLNGETNPRKRFYKTPAQLWIGLEVALYDEYFWWQQKARELRLALKTKVVTNEECLESAGWPGEAFSYVLHAEVAVAHYLGIASPASIEKEEDEEASCVESAGRELRYQRAEETCGGGAASYMQLYDSAEQPSVCLTAAADPAKEQLLGRDLPEQLHTLPDRLEVDPKTTYSHFAGYDLGKTRRAEGKQQVAMLRQLADLLDPNGEELFYYYVVPRLCKEDMFPADGTTISDIAADVRRFSPGKAKDKWKEASAGLRKQLGDGDAGGLVTLGLDRLEGCVLKLHGMAREGIEAHWVKISEREEDVRIRRAHAPDGPRSNAVVIF